MLPELDKDGFLANLDDWSPDVAHLLAEQEAITLTDEHWEIIHALQDFYREYEISPAMRPLSKYLKQTLGPEKSGSIYLMTLFPGSPAKLAAKIAGLPRPENCL
ncbi:MAG: sulfurtransferase TusE [Oceanospirillaceae bacterium]|nr:sulfurtransferase TusE [Oceanospirillaceae bacterium]MBT11066.1 sulfurtransferase TusE [Oceanospirillaceae bacterium]|tara:strand:- start:251543 stop:251854 length:312 start_codon:yes stop_codon:yes gene_type:complete